MKQEAQSLPSKPPVELRVGSALEVLNRGFLIEGASALGSSFVDDSPESRDVLAQMLRRIGSVVFVAANGEAALEVVRTHGPDIVFMDIRMPIMHLSNYLS